MELDFARYELPDWEWLAIKPLLPNKPRGVPRVDDRRVLNGIFWVLRSGAPWRDLPRSLGPCTTSYNRFVRWRRAVVWSRIMSALATTHDASVQMIDTSIVRAHQHAACIARNRSQSMGRSRGSCARGRSWLDELANDPSVTTESIAQRKNCSIRKINMTISLAFLAPDLVKAAIDGRLPQGTGIARLTDLPTEWSRQRERLGLPAH